MNLLKTERLTLRQLNLDDAPFVFGIVNEPSWLQYIGDRGVNSLEDAREYIRTGPLAMYDEFGFGMFMVELQANYEPIGLCGLLKRDGLTDVDIGFAFLPTYWNKGYAYEAAAAIVSYGKEVHDLSRIVAITACDNHASSKLLERLGFRFERLIQLPGDDEEIKLYAIAMHAEGKSITESLA